MPTANFIKRELPQEPFDVILLTHGGLEDLTVPCVSALYANTKNLFHLIIVDDSTRDMDDGKDWTPEWVDKLQIDNTNITYVHSGIPYKSGNQIINIGLSKGNSRFVAIIGNSTVVEPDWDITPIGMLSQNRKIGAVGMKCLKLGWSAAQDGQIESAGIFMDKFVPCDKGRDQPGHRFPQSYACFSVQWSSIFVRRDAVLGNLDENLWQGFVGWDDIDNSIYLRYKGWEIWYCGLSVAYHKTHATRGSDKNEILYKNRLNGEIFFKRWGYWDKYKEECPYAREFFPNGAVQFLANANDLPLTLSEEEFDLLHPELVSPKRKR